MLKRDIRALELKSHHRLANIFALFAYEDEHFVYIQHEITPESIIGSNEYMIAKYFLASLCSYIVYNIPPTYNYLPPKCVCRKNEE